MSTRGLSLRALAAQIGYDPGYLSKVLNGHKPVSPYVARLVDDALDAGGAIIAAAEHAPAPRQVIDAELVRRGLDDALAAGTLSDASLDDWDRTVTGYGLATRDRAAVVLLEDLAADLAELKRALDRRRPASSLRRLARVTAQMSGLMCLTLIKVGDRQAFRRWGRTARTAAADSGDSLTSSWAVAEEAYGYYYCGDHGSAIMVSRHAQELAAGMPCVGAALAAALEMRAHAATGAADGARDALRRAEQILAGLDGDQLAASAFGYNEAQLRFHEGSAFTQLGDTRAALAAQERALELVAPGDYTDWALIRLDRAVCLLHDGDPSGAVAIAVETMQTLTEPQRVGIIATRGRELLAALPAAHRTGGPSRDFRELLTLTAETKEVPPH